MKKVMIKALLSAMILGLTAQNISATDNSNPGYWQTFKSKLPSWGTTAKITGGLGTAGALGYGSKQLGNYLLDQSTAAAQQATAAAQQATAMAQQAALERAADLGFGYGAAENISPQSLLPQSPLPGNWAANAGDYLKSLPSLSQVGNAAYAAPGAALRGLGRGTQYLGSGLGTGLGYAGSAASGLWNYLPGQNAYASRFGNWAAEKGANLGVSDAWNALPAETQQALIGAATLAALAGTAGYGYKQGWFSRGGASQQKLKDAAALVINALNDESINIDNTKQLQTELTDTLKGFTSSDPKINPNIQLINQMINNIEKQTTNDKLTKLLQQILNSLTNTLNKINPEPIE